MSSSTYDAGELTKKGVLLAKKRRFLDASKVFTRVIQMNPKDVEAYYLRGHARVKLNQAEGAVRDFKRAISLDREHVESFFYLGILLARMEDWQKSLWCFGEASKLSHPEAPLYVARIRRQLQQFEDELPSEGEPAAEPPEREEVQLSALPAVSVNGQTAEAVSVPQEDPLIPPQLLEKMRKIEEAKTQLPELDDEDAYEEVMLAPADLVDIAADMLKRFAKAHCGRRVEMEEVIQKGLFGLGKKVEKKVVRWRVRVKKRLSDDHTGLLGESMLGATLELNRDPTTRIRISLPESDIYRVELQVEKEMGGMLKHQLTRLVTVWKREIPADADTLNDALQILLAERYLIEENGQLIYRE